MQNLRKAAEPLSRRQAFGFVDFVDKKCLSEFTSDRLKTLNTADIFIKVFSGTFMKIADNQAEIPQDFRLGAPRLLLTALRAKMLDSIIF